ncbi:MAG: hypothetical protein ABR568_16995 [Pyrinomonadaceae bacterium]
MALLTECDCWNAAAAGHDIGNYSIRSAVVGSNPAARRAGSQEAMTAINRKSADTKTT